MNWSGLKGIVARSAPIAGTLLGGPAGAAVGGMIASALGVDSTPAAIDAAIKADPNAAVKLRQFELEHSAELKRLQFKTLEAELGDKANARAAHKHSKMPASICIALTLMVAGMAGLIWLQPMPDEAKTMGMMMLGALLTKWGDSIAYFVGTTRGSAEKNRLLRS